MRCRMASYSRIEPAVAAFNDDAEPVIEMLTIPEQTVPPGLIGVPMLPGWLGRSNTVMSGAAGEDAADRESVSRSSSSGGIATTATNSGAASPDSASSATISAGIST